MNDIIKIIQALEDSNISLKEITKTIENEIKVWTGWFLGMLLGTVTALCPVDFFTFTAEIFNGKRHRFVQCLEPSC